MYGETERNICHEIVLSFGSYGFIYYYYQEHCVLLQDRRNVNTLPWEYWMDSFIYERIIQRRDDDAIEMKVQHQSHVILKFISIFFILFCVTMVFHDYFSLSNHPNSCYKIQKFIFVQILIETFTNGHCIQQQSFHGFDEMALFFFFIFDYVNSK